MQVLDKRVVASLLGMMIGVGIITTQQTAWAQAGDESGKTGEFRIRRVVPEFIATPDVSTISSVKRGIVGGTPVKWLRVEVEFDSSYEFADNVEFRWYIAVAGDKKPVVFFDSVTHINVKRGQRHISAIFMPPRTVDRYAKNSQVKQIAVQLWHDQKLVDTGGWPNDPKTRWWEEVKPERGALLNLLQTPFGVLEYDRYEQIKVSPTSP